MGSWWREAGLDGRSGGITGRRRYSLGKDDGVYFGARHWVKWWYSCRDQYALGGTEWVTTSRSGDDRAAMDRPSGE